MKHIAVVISLFSIASLAASDAAACPIADQVRVVPLGAIGDEVLSVEIVQRRDGKMTGEKWYDATPRLVVHAKDGKRTAVFTGTKARLDSTNYVEWLRDTYDAFLVKAKKRAKKSKGRFVAAKLTSITECDYLGRCGSFELTGNGVELPSGASRPIDTPASVIKSHGEVTDFSGWGIERVEVYEIGKRKLALVSVGVGWDMDPCEHSAAPCKDTRKAQSIKVPKSVRAGLRFKAGLHHGREWDAMVLDFDSRPAKR